MHPVIRIPGDISTIVLSAIAENKFKQAFDDMNSNVSFGKHLTNMLIAHYIITSVIVISNMVLYGKYSYNNNLTTEFKQRYIFVEFSLIIIHLALSTILLAVIIVLHGQLKDEFSNSESIRTALIMTYVSASISIIMDLVNIFN
jgi:predicted membrane protein